MRAVCPADLIIHLTSLIKNDERKYYERLLSLLIPFVPTVEHKASF
jgi:hypothetical protein